MILFFCQNKATKNYYNKLAKKITLPAKVVFSHVRIPDIAALFCFDRALLSEVVEQKVTEDKLRKGRTFSALGLTLLWFKTRWFFASDKRIIKKCKPELVVLWNGLKFRRAIFKVAAQQSGIQCVFMENGLLPHTTVCDLKGVNALNSMPRDSEFYLKRSLIEEVKAIDLVARTSKNVKKNTHQQLPEKFIFVPFQVDTDSQIVLFSPWIKNMRHLYDVIVSVVDDIDGLKVVLKEHPSSPVDYSYLHEELPESLGVFANDYSTQELIEKAEAVVTINSTVGIESILLGRKVITLGQAFYNIDSLVFHCENENVLKNVLQQVEHLEFNAQLRESFLDYLKNEYLIDGSWKEASDEHVDLVCNRLTGYHESVLTVDINDSL